MIEVKFEEGRMSLRPELISFIEVIEDVVNLVERNKDSRLNVKDSLEDVKKQWGGFQVHYTTDKGEVILKAEQISMILETDYTYIVTDDKKEIPVKETYDEAMEKYNKAFEVTYRSKSKE